jgi:hypothetical protein
MIELIGLLLVFAFLISIYFMVAVCCGVIYIGIVAVALAIGVARKLWRDAYDGTSRRIKERRRVRRADTR